MLTEALSRIEQALPGVVVSTRDRLAGYAQPDVLPLVYLYPASARVLGEGSKARVEEQTWVVAICVRHLKGDNATDQADTLRTAIRQALDGWSPAPGQGPWRYQGFQWLAPSELGFIEQAVTFTAHHALS